MIKIANIRNIVIQIIVLIALLGFTISCSQTDHSLNRSPDNIDSTDYFINLSKVSDISTDKLYNLNEAYRTNSLKNNDSLKIRNLLTIIYAAKEINDTSFIKKISNEAIILSQQLKDTSVIAFTHFNLGYFYYSKEAWEMSFRNYYQAYEYFEAIGNEFYSGTMLLSMGNIQNNVKDYTGSEISTFKAINKFDKKNNYLNLYRCYNNLGLLFYKLKEYDQALEYHNTAYEYLKKVENKRTFVEGNLNNIGLVYQQKENYSKAISFFDKALKNRSLKELNVELYSKILDNLTYNKFLNGISIDLEANFLKALKLRDSIKFVSGIISSKLHLSEYYVSKADTMKAIDYATDALQLAESVNNNRDWLASLKLLSNLDHQNADTYLTDYVKLSDSLQEQERIIRNKFTRIQFETDEYVEETKRLTVQNKLIFVIGVISVLLISLLYFVKRQRSKTRELIFEKNQQIANTEIYSLMLKQQTKLEEGRFEERHRISEELHDGVLGKLFGTRVGLGFLSINGDENTMQKHKSYLSEIQTIEKEIRDISHALKNEILSSKSDFISIIEDYVNSQSKINSLKCYFKYDNTILWNEIDDNIKVNLYRIIQVGLQNIFEHAKSNKIEINLHMEEKTLNLSIKDDGVGLDFEKRKKGIGLKNIQARILKLNGEFNIISIQNQGTHLTVSIPI